MSAFERAWDAFRGVVDDVELDRLLKDVEREHAHQLAEQIRETTRQQLTRVTATNREDWARTWAYGRERAADQIDPEVSR